MYLKVLIFLFFAWPMIVFGDASSGSLNPASENPFGPLTLETALNLALLQNPELTAFSWEIRAAEARAVQSGLFPNPEIETSVENVGGNNDPSGFDGAEATVQISQTIELGGKRLKRKQVSNLKTRLAGWDYESKRLDILAETTAAFWDVSAAQESLNLAGELARLSEALSAAVAERVRAGKVPPMEALQSEISLTTARIERDQAAYALDTARKRLAALWGSPDPVFASVTGDANTTEPVPSLAELEAKIAKNPDVARWDDEITTRSAFVTLADAEAVPDITIGAGPRYAAETNDTSMVMALSLPVPLLNRNQGNRQEARHDLSKAREKQRAVIIDARSRLAQARQELSTALLAADALEKDALPAARAAHASALEGYRQGKFSYSVVLEAQRTLFEIRRQQVEALNACRKARITMDRLTGQAAFGK